jgi:hypothetical protein
VDRESLMGLAEVSDAYLILFTYFITRGAKGDAPLEAMRRFTLKRCHSTEHGLLKAEIQEQVSTTGGSRTPDNRNIPGHW